MVVAAWLACDSLYWIQKLRLLNVTTTYYSILLFEDNDENKTEVLVSENMDMFNSIWLLLGGDINFDDLRIA